MEEPKSIIEELLEKYETPEQKKEVVQFIINMKGTQGWKILVETLEKNIVDLMEDITDPPDGMKEKEINRLRDKVKLQRGFIRLPDQIIEDFSEKATQIDVDTEVY